MGKKAITLERSLTLVIAITSCVALLQAYIAFVIYDQYSFRQDLTRQLGILAKVSAGNSGGALYFSDEGGLNESLGLLSSYRHIHYAAIVTSTGEIFTEYRVKPDEPDQITSFANPRELSEVKVSGNDYIELSEEIYQNGEKIGYLYLYADMGGAKERLVQFTLIGGTILVLALLAGLMLTRRIIPVISRPILNLVTLTGSRSRQQDYSPANNPTRISELKALAVGVGDMLSDIQQRETALRNSEQRLSLALKGSGEGMWDWNIAARTTYFDKRCCGVLGLDQEEVDMQDSVWRTRIHLDDVKNAKQAFIKTLKGQTMSCDVEYRVRNEGGWTWLHLRGSVMAWDERGRPVRMTGTMLDVTERKRTEEQLALYATAFNNSSDAVVILDQKFNILAVNNTYTDITQFSSEDVLGRNDVFLNSENNPANFQQVLMRRVEKRGKWSGESWDTRKSGEVFPQELAINGVLNKKQKLTHYIAVFSDITERKKTEEELRFMANYDTLTKLPNRGMFQGGLLRALQAAKRNTEQLALLFIDLDKFKQVNDVLGHDAGDDLLRQVAKRLKSTVRDADLVARLAGDEFTIILENIHSDREAEIVAKKILMSFEAGFTVKGNDAGVGASVGIALFPHDATETEELMHCADTAMYHAKSLGRNNLKFYSPGMNTESDNRTKLERELRSAFNRRELEIYYQPKVDVISRQVVGFEALLRWQHPDLGWVSPAEFISVAEDTGLIKPVGEWVLRQSARQLKAWHAAGHDSLSMAVNVSAKQFQLADFPLEVAIILKEEQVEARFLELELTESLIMDDPDKVILMLHVLKNLGVSLSVDDFGTGYSSLSYLHRFPIDTLKVDRAFVSEMDDGDDGATIAATIINMAHNLNLNVIAEGVETKSQFDLLSSLRCEQIQGYYFSKAIPAREVELLLERDFDEVVGEANVGAELVP